jgi:hypothetical protein
VLSGACGPVENRERKKQSSTAVQIVRGAAYPLAGGEHGPRRVRREQWCAEAHRHVRLRVRSLATRPRQPTDELLCRGIGSCTIFFVLRSASGSALFISASAHYLPLVGRSLSGPMSERASRPARARHCDALHEHVQVFFHVSVQVFCHVSLSRLAGHVRAKLGQRFRVALSVAVVVGSGDEGLMDGGWAPLLSA